MKIKVWCDSGANIRSCREAVIDTEKQWGIPGDEWEALSDDDKYKLVEEWAWERLSVGWDDQP